MHRGKKLRRENSQKESTTNFVNGPASVEEFFLARRPSSSAEVRGLVIHDIKEVEGVRQQEEQEDKSDEEIGDEVNGEVEEVTQHTHET